MLLYISIFFLLKRRDDSYIDYTNLLLNSKLPNTLSKSEIETCFKKFKAGDLDAREQLIIHNIKLVI